MRIFFLPLLFISLFFSAKSQTKITIDGNFEDWETRQPIHVDPAGDASLDIRRLWAESDELFFYFSFELNREIELAENNDLELYLDTDNNRATGHEIAGIGAEIIYEFGNRIGDLWTKGSAVKAYHNDLGLFTAPTVTADRFEIAIRRDDNFFNDEIFSGDKIKIYLRDNRFGGDKIPDSGAIEYELNNNGFDEIPEWSFEKKSVEDIRILSYNVERDAIFDLSKQNSFRRIIQATKPQILAFQEIYDRPVSQVADLVEQFLPSAPGERWYAAEVRPDIKVVSRFPILREELIQGGNSSSSGNGAFLIDLGSDYPTNLLLVNAHLPCCNNDANRQAEIDQIMGFIRESKEEANDIPLNPNTPIVILGDMNMVGDNRQLETFLSGDILNEFAAGEDFAPDWDESDLEDAIPVTTGYPAAFTWFNEMSSFNPGRLDLVIYSGSVLELKNSFALFTRPLPSNLLQANGLFAEDAIAASDHLPVIADFEIKNVSAHREPVITDFQFQCTPNPFFEKLTGTFNLKKPAHIYLSVFNAEGRKIASILNDFFTAGNHEFSFERSDLPTGTYFLNLKTGDQSSVFKVIKK